MATADAASASTLDVCLEAASAHEVPPADICVRVARCYEGLGAFDEAFAWLARATEPPASFVHWCAAAGTLTRLTGHTRPPVRRSVRLALTGSYTTNQLTSLLPLAALRFGVDIDVVHEGLYGQYQQDLIDCGSRLFDAEPDLLVLAVHEGAVDVPRFSDAPEDEVERELQRWHDLWRAARQGGITVVQHTFARRPEVPLGHLSEGVEGSRYAMLGRLNRRLYEAAGTDVVLVDCDRLAGEFGRDRWFDDRYWFRAKQAVALDALPMLAQHTAAVIAAWLGVSRKCLVVDLDDTLWGGIVGEDGPTGIAVGGDGVGQAFAAFQDYLLELKERGVILAVASRNNESDVLEAFERHPGMRLRRDDFAAMFVNWDDKPTNLRRIAAALDLSMDALVFVDDNPSVRQIVRRLLPEVDVVALPPEPAAYRRALATYLGFETVAITAEDLSRTMQYRARAAAAELRTSAADIEAFYRDLRMHAVIAPFDEEHLPRIAQLVRKTNQFNLTTRRYDIDGLRAFMESERHVTRFLTLTDRLGDHGLVAVLIGAVDGNAIEIDTFLMSCRVIGRTVEAQLLDHLSNEALRLEVGVLRGTYAPTAKNEIVRSLYETFGFAQVREEPDGTTHWEYDLRERGPIANEFIQELAW